MRIKVEDAMFCLVDVQERLFPHMANKELIEQNLVTLIKGLRLHELPFIVNEQYKKGIGETIPALRELVDSDPHFEKTTFSCCKNEPTLEAIKANDDYTNVNTGRILKNNTEAVISLMQYDRMARTQLKSSENNLYEYDMNYVKGYREKLHKNWITARVNKKNAKQENVGENYHKSDGLTFDKAFDVYINSDFTEPGWASEGTRRTNDGRAFYSYLDVVKSETIDPKDWFNVAKQKEFSQKIKLELADLNAEVEEETEKMKSRDYIPSRTGMSPVYSLGSNGEMFVTDMDISVKKQLLESEMKINNNIDTVVAKTFAHAIDLHYSKKTSFAMLDEIERDANENFLDSRGYWAGGKKNAMTYVKLGPNERNSINKEIWPGLPRYMKLEIFRRHQKNTDREVANIAIETGISEDKIWDSKAQKIKEDLNAALDDINTDEQKVLKLGRQLNNKLANNLRSRLYTGKNATSGDSKTTKKELDEIRTKISQIEKMSPYVATRRNMVYHQFGNRDPMVFSPGTLPKFNKIISLFKWLDMLWKELVQVAKINIVLRDIPVLLYNILSNILLAVLQGRNPITEVKEQIKGMQQIHQYMKDSKEFARLSIKMRTGLQTPADVRRSKMLQAKMSRNPVKPLVDAGLYTSITEDLSNEELHKESYFDYHTGKLKKKLPQGVQDAFDIMFITKKTSGFGVLLKAMQYSDFGARYAGYNRLMKQKGMTQEKALKTILDNQINYNFSHGKVIQWMNARGLVLFTKFWEGIQKVILRTSMEKPLNVFIAVLGGSDFMENSPLGDSMFDRTPLDLFYGPGSILSVLTEDPALVQMMKREF